ncbi:hypothetical protein BpHYR1_024248 [Brachionus plicatilis]|uniref:Uncharacterized protein n=1 Tax=Brachionus plicatilis TaxID=10195 RepID=A0A3M7RTQ6_BRAPC|nr:hypothetical protein BpHYR1_024248 [Brachionus plicatilis]
MRLNDKLFEKLRLTINSASSKAVISYKIYFKNLPQHLMNTLIFQCSANHDLSRKNYLALNGPVKKLSLKKSFGKNLKNKLLEGDSLNQNSKTSPKFQSNFHYLNVKRTLFNIRKEAELGLYLGYKGDLFQKKKLLQKFFSVNFPTPKFNLNEEIIKM